MDSMSFSVNGVGMGIDRSGSHLSMSFPGGPGAEPHADDVFFHDSPEFFRRYYYHHAGFHQNLGDPNFIHHGDGFYRDYYFRHHGHHWDGRRYRLNRETMALQAQNRIHRTMMGLKIAEEVGKATPAAKAHMAEVGRKSALVSAVIATILGLALMGAGLWIFLNAQGGGFAATVLGAIGALVVAMPVWHYVQLRDNETYAATVGLSLMANQAA